MGFESRDYSQDESWKDTARHDTPVTKWIVILTIVLFVMQVLSISPTTQTSALFELFSLKASNVLAGQVWRAVTFIFCHEPTEIIGLVFSLLILWRFGNELERMYGSRELALFYLAMTLFVGTAFTVWGLVVPLPLPLYGSFTGALGLMALFATHYPRMEVCILPMIVIQLRWLVALYALFGLFPALRVLQAGGGVIGLAYASSVLSIAFALLYRRFEWRLDAVVGQFSPATWRRAWRTRTARQTLRVFQPPSEAEDLEGKVDVILAKIHEQGSDSLTDAERAILTRASEKIKNRTRS